MPFLIGAHIRQSVTWRRICGSLLLACLCLFLLAGCGPASTSRGRKRNVRYSRSVPRDYDYRRGYRPNQNRLIAEIKRWIGTPYCLGGTTRKCVDCSAFVKNVFKKAYGARLPRTAAQQHQQGKRIRRNQLRKGDLVFFRINRSKIDHVGIWVGRGTFAHASLSSGVTYSKLSSPYYSGRYAGARRLF